MQDAPVFSCPVSRQQRKSKIKSGHTFVRTRLEVNQINYPHPIHIFSRSYLILAVCMILYQVR
ncbi:MAG: hypothetical protein ACJAXV_000320 [Bacteroidia bacterium]|mgnify:CR=1 FL=1|jgi:hypothetical protein